MITNRYFSTVVLSCRNKTVAPAALRRRQPQNRAGNAPLANARAERNASPTAPTQSRVDRQSHHSQVFRQSLRRAFPPRLYCNNDAVGAAMDAAIYTYEIIPPRLNNIRLLLLLEIFQNFTPGTGPRRSLPHFAPFFANSQLPIPRVTIPPSNFGQCRKSNDLSMIPRKISGDFLLNSTTPAVNHTSFPP